MLRKDPQSLADARPDRPSLEEDLFRPAAREHAARGRRENDLLRLSPYWTRWVFRTLLLMLGLALAYGLVGRTREYASGLAVIRTQNGDRITALASGTVETVAVAPGDEVHAGDLLVRFHSEDQSNVLSHLQTEFDLVLVRLLRDPTDDAARGTLANLRARMKLAQARLEECSLRAPRDGWVQDLRISPGQRLTAGESVLTLVDREPIHDLVAFLPGEVRPMLHPGQELRLKMHGYVHAPLELTIGQIPQDVVAPRTAAASLGAEWSDALPLNGSVVVVTADLSTPTFVADGVAHSFFGGMQGTVEVCVRDQTLLGALVPGIGELLDRLGL